MGLFVRHKKFLDLRCVGVACALAACAILAGCSASGGPSSDGVIDFGALGTPAAAAEAQAEEPKDFTEASVDVANQVYTGFELTPAVTVELGGKTLSEGRDYTLRYEDNVDAGEAHVIVTGTGDYTGSIGAAFDIEPHPQGWDTVDGTLYYYTEDGERSADNFVPGNDGTWYYVGSDGRPVSDEWIASSGHYFRIGADGHPQTNSWASFNGEYYYLNDLGSSVHNEALAYQGSLYYLDAAGHPLANSWLELNGKTYYFGADGAAVTGLATIEGDAYIFNDDGSLRHISNDERLDRLVCKIIRDHTGFDARAAYDYVAYSFTYLTGSTDAGFANWEEHYALGLLDAGEGNCYGFSSLLHFLYNAMGYDSKTIDGLCSSRRNGGYYHHCWVEVYLDGETFVCDPVLEVAYYYSGIYSYFITYADNRAATCWCVYVV